MGDATLRDSYRVVKWASLKGGAHHVRFCREGTSSSYAALLLGRAALARVSWLAAELSESKALRSELREGEVRVIAGLTLFLLD